MVDHSQMICTFKRNVGKHHLKDEIFCENFLLSVLFSTNDSFLHNRYDWIFKANYPINFYNVSGNHDVGNQHLSQNFFRLWDSQPSGNGREISSEFRKVELLFRHRRLEICSDLCSDIGPSTKGVSTLHIQRNYDFH